MVMCGSPYLFFATSNDTVFVQNRKACERRAGHTGVHFALDRSFRKNVAGWWWIRQGALEYNSTAFLFTKNYKLYRG